MVTKVRVARAVHVRVLYHGLSICTLYPNGFLFFNLVPTLLFFFFFAAWSLIFTFVSVRSQLFKSSVVLTE